MGRVLRTSQADPAADVMDEALRVLGEGGVLVMPTDSVYGIGCAATPANPGHERIFAIKRRERSQTLPLLVADPHDLHRLCDGLPTWAAALASRHWPGALTLVVRASEELPAEYRAANGTVALRCPDSNLVRGLARRMGVPLAVTSANTHGLEAATSGSGMEGRIVDEADLTIDAGEAPVGVASTIVDCTGTAPKILREGSLSAAEILATASQGGKMAGC